MSEFVEAPDKTEIQCFYCGRKGTRGFVTFGAGGIGRRISFAKLVPKSAAPVDFVGSAICKNQRPCNERRRRSLPRL